MEQKIVVHLRGGGIHKGVTHDFDPERDTFHLLPAEGGGVPFRVRLVEAKAVFYVKDYLGNRDFIARRHFDQVQRNGRRVILTFYDDEQMWGTIADGDEGKPGFYFYPADERDNNIRLFVPKSSLKDLQVVA